MPKSIENQALIESQHTIQWVTLFICLDSYRGLTVVLDRHIHILSNFSQSITSGT